ncbi:hypothetical protein PSPO01_09083 [Paraphaeosphaeria sporulosa]
MSTMPTPRPLPSSDARAPTKAISIATSLPGMELLRRGKTTTD